MTTRYVIMANGQGSRWAGFMATPKHLLEIDGESLLHRIVRQLSEFDPGAEVIISAANPRYEVDGATRYTPLVNEIELDRFVPELIVDNVCFLYGDTYYEDEAVNRIVSEDAVDVTFFGDVRSIVAVKARRARTLNHHLRIVRDLYTQGRIQSCIGWQVYHSVVGMPLDGKAIGPEFIDLDFQTSGFNTPDDYADFWANKREKSMSW